jgi:hypothetical protein
VNFMGAIVPMVDGLENIRLYGSSDPHKAHLIVLPHFSHTHSHGSLSQFEQGQTHGSLWQYVHVQTHWFFRQCLHLQTQLMVLQSGHLLMFSTKVCSGCLSPEHIHKECPYLVCNGCGVQGHVEKSCKANKCDYCHELPLKCKCSRHTFVILSVFSDLKWHSPW